MTSSNKGSVAIILAGGAGRRLNGADKGLQQYRGKRLVEHVIGVIEPQVETIYICANRSLQTYKSFGFKVLSDEYDDYQGPMSGISTALRLEILNSQADKVLISSCDAPHLPQSLMARLETELSRSDLIDASIAHDGNRRQNLHCLIKRQAWQSLVDFFDNGGRAMHRWFAEINTINVDFSNEANAFVNINTIDQLS
jgi:molybdenum cofactor guanylyltransferase